MFKGLQCVTVSQPSYVEKKYQIKIKILPNYIISFLQDVFGFDDEGTGAICDYIFSNKEAF